MLNLFGGRSLTDRCDNRCWSIVLVCSFVGCDLSCNTLGMSFSYAAAYYLGYIAETCIILGYRYPRRSWLMHRPIGGYRRSQRPKSLTSLNTTRRLGYCKFVSACEWRTVRAQEIGVQCRDVNPWPWDVRPSSGVCGLGSGVAKWRKGATHPLSGKYIFFGM